MIHQTRSLLAAAALLFSFGPVAPSAWAAESESLEQQVARTKSPEQQLALAARFDQEAATAKSRADLHRKMAENLKKSAVGAFVKWKLDEHCASLAKAYDEAAASYAAMAEAYRQMAKQ